MSNGMALDTLWVQDQDGTPFDRPDKLAKLAFVFENVLTGELKPHIALERPPAFPSRTSVFTVPPRVLIDNQASASHTVIEVNGRDRPGLLWELTRELTRLSLQVSSAKISTYGEKVVDVFYVKNLFGHKVEHPQKLAEIRATLEAVLAKGNLAAPRSGNPEPPQARRGGGRGSTQSDNMKRPAPADRRREPLPQERPKPGSEDPQAPAQLRAILDSPSFRQADRDSNFCSAGTCAGCG